MSNPRHGIDRTGAFPDTVAEILSRTARQLPGKTALTFADREWTYAELDRATGRVAARLLEFGFSRGDRVAVFGKNSDAYVVLYLGCARAGLVHVPINYNARGDDLAYQIQQSDPRIVFTDADLDGFVDAAVTFEGLRGSLRGGQNLDVLAWATAPNGSLHDENGVRGDDLVQILYTSGTTSRPKGAALTHRGQVHQYRSCIDALDLCADDVMVHALPLYHTAQMHVFLLPALAVGATNHLLETPDLDEIMRRVPSQGVTSLFLPPTVWVSLANHPGLADADLGGLQKAYYGASIMPVPVLQKLRSRLPDVGFFNCFGQTEIGPLATVLRPEEHDARPDSVGRPVLFVDLRVVDTDMNDVAPGELGEVVYQSPQLCTEYWRKPAETAEAFAGGWFHSGDLARMDEQGYLFVVDRIKDVVNTGGVLVASREVEDALYSHPAVAEVAVIGVPDDRWIEAITAAVVLKHDVAAEDLIAFAKQRLAPHKVPKTVFVIDELPKNPSGKILKRDLRVRFGGTASAVPVSDKQQPN
ncbi:fatty acyl-CoA synthetase [Hoyosella subflava]|uniref:Acyl-CoA synthetase (AMP-forming)/AMP-acid ligase II n=1 Tax=Hoyosella subflava (strain DSM 45089 / JCM 17490 / NBRC 109087 / DQS3-9A1) TaxID=443218 RepID=F6ELD0_HOYSD|nr:fatty acyl-CoA synthetase [Hoyosella subflava]AEF39222.1 Acyl-CoA synthetase (AMP-forming)/AMP-acid ligase II [Hoyosella subflava DQS3-9A1]